MYKRVRKFFRAAHRDQHSYETLSYLFDPTSTCQPNDILLQSLRNTLGYRGNFHNVSSKWWTFIPFLYRLQQWLRERELKSFCIFPIMDHRRHHVQYDGMALQQLLRHKELCPADWYDFRPQVRKYWDKYFHIDQVETKGHKFYGSICTNGVQVSIRMKRKKRPELDEESRLKRIKENYLNGQYSDEIGLDPGARYPIGGVKRNIPTQQETSVLYSSASYRHDSGEYNRSNKYRYWTKDFFAKIDEERNNLPDKASTKGDPLVFVNFELKHLMEWQQLTTQKKFAKLTFERYIARRRTIDLLASRVLGRTKLKNCENRWNTKSTIVFAGSTEISPIIKGYVRTPLKSVMRSSLARFTDIVMVDEFRSTAVKANHNYEHVDHL